MSAQGELASDLAQDLRLAQMDARCTGRAVPFDRLTWRDGSDAVIPSLRPYGHQGYEWALYTDDWEISLGRRAGGEWVGYAQVRSRYLWRVGAETAIQRVERLLASWLQTEASEVRLSRLDQCVDLAGWPMLTSDKGRFTTPATHREDWPDRLPRPESWGLEGYRNAYDRTSGLLATVYFGSGRSPMLARLYRKDWQMQQRPQVAWYGDVARARGWSGDRDDPLVRLEYQYRREHLRRMGIERPSEAVAGAGDLWRDAMGWLVYRRGTGASVVRQRRPARWWEQVASVFDSSRLGLVRGCGEIRPQVDHLIDQANGLLTSWAALTGSRDMTTAFEAFLTVMRDRFEERHGDAGEGWREAVDAKLARFGLLRADREIAATEDGDQAKG